MVNAKRIFFLMVRKGLRGVRLCCPEIYSTCDSKSASASRVFDYRKARQSGRGFNAATIRSRMCLRCERCQLENSPAFQRSVKRFARGRRDNSPALKGWAIVVGFAITSVQSKRAMNRSQNKSGVRVFCSHRPVDGRKRTEPTIRPWFAELSEILFELSGI